MIIWRHSLKKPHDMLNDSSSLLKLAGVVAGTALAQISPILAAVPVWVGDVKEWGGICAILAGVFATLAIAVGQWLKNIRTVQEIKTQQRKDMQELRRAAEDAVCMRRRSTGECPLCSQKLITEHAQPEIHHDEHCD